MQVDEGTNDFADTNISTSGNDVSAVFMSWRQNMQVDEGTNQAYKQKLKLWIQHSGGEDVPINIPSQVIGHFAFLSPFRVTR